MIAGIILAAGASSRMGSPKALLDYRGQTFLNRLIRVLSGVCDPVIVVLGGHAESIRARTTGDVKLAINPNPERGQLSSLVTGLAEVPQDADGFLFLPVDCPAVEPETVADLIEVFARRETGVMLAIPRHDGRRGHPVCCAPELIPEFLALPPLAQARDVIRRHRDRTVYLETVDAGVLGDIDDPEAYRALVESPLGKASGSRRA